MTPIVGMIVLVRLAGIEGQCVPGIVTQGPQAATPGVVDVTVFPPGKAPLFMVLPFYAQSHPASGICWPVGA